MAKLYKKTTFTIMKFFSIIIGSVLGSIFNISCGPFAVEYGAPHADYKISGTVKSAQSQTEIPGIAVLRYHGSDTLFYEDSTVTDSLGKYSFTYSDGISEWTIRAKDIDGDENGNFSTKDTTISIPNSELTGGDGDWYEGSAEKTVDIDLEENS